MMADTNIEWADKSWNPVIGCSKVSDGCAHCYAERMAYRLRGVGVPGYDAVVDERGRWTGQVGLMAARLEQPYKWKKPQRIFVGSMTDLFHPKVPRSYQAQVWRVMKENPQHTFMILTKRAAVMRAFALDVQTTLGRLPNVWLGVSVENQEQAKQRVGELLITPAAKRFVSCEPLLGPVFLGDNLNRIDWVIVGGESGPKARPAIRVEWVRNLLDSNLIYGRAFFFKQWGEWYPLQKVDGFWVGGAGDVRMGEPDVTQGDYGWVKMGKHDAGNYVDGMQWNQYPE